jgi:hypothetical protein
VNTLTILLTLASSQPIAVSGIAREYLPDTKASAIKFSRLVDKFERLARMKQGQVLKPGK